ncbi:MAG: D-glycero-alpha-D-manno-heptose-1,7-bisphosphate 7-phosphatase [Planctomycetaceae bacterium]
MGTPERLAKVERDLESGVVARRQVANPMPAILLDRDGTVNVEVGRITRPDDLALIPGIGAAINLAHAGGYLVGIVTNQPVIARGDVTFAQLDAIHGRMEMLLAESRAFVDGIYVCPHHPDRGFPGEVADLKGPCDCRKPGTGLVEQAAAELDLDISRSWLVGDTTSDVECARAAGLFSVLIGTGHAGADGRFRTAAALRFPDAPAAIEFIVGRFPALWGKLTAAAASATPGTRIVIKAVAADDAANTARLVVEAVRRRGLPVRLVGEASDTDRGCVDVVVDVDTTVGPDHLITVNPPAAS